MQAYSNNTRFGIFKASVKEFGFFKTMRLLVSGISSRKYYGEYGSNNSTMVDSEEDINEPTDNYTSDQRLHQ